MTVVGTPIHNFNNTLEMKRFIFSLLMPLVVAVAFANVYVVTADTKVNVRSMPSETTGRVIGKLNPGDTIVGSPHYDAPREWVMMTYDAPYDIAYVKLEYLTRATPSAAEKDSVTLLRSDIPLYGFNSRWLRDKDNACTVYAAIFLLWLATIVLHFHFKHKLVSAKVCYTRTVILLALSLIEILYICGLGLDSMWILDEIWTSGGWKNLFLAVGGYCLVFIMLCFQYAAFRSTLADLSLQADHHGGIRLKPGLIALAICTIAMFVASWKWPGYVVWALGALAASQIIQAAAIVVMLRRRIGVALLAGTVYLTGVTSILLVLANYYGFMFCVLVCYLIYLFLAHAPINTDKVTVMGADGVQYQIYVTDIDAYNAGAGVRAAGSEYGDGYAKNKVIRRGINSPRIAKPPRK